MRLGECVWSTVLLSEPLRQVGQLDGSLGKSHKMLKRLRGLINLRKDFEKFCLSNLTFWVRRENSILQVF